MSMSVCGKNIVMYIIYYTFLWPICLLAALVLVSFQMFYMTHIHPCLMHFLQQLKEGEDQAEHEERKLNKRAHNMLQIINNRLQTSSDVSFKVRKSTYFSKNFATCTWLLAPELHSENRNYSQIYWELFSSKFLTFCHSLYDSKNFVLYWVSVFWCTGKAATGIVNNSGAWKRKHMSRSYGQCEW